MDARIHIHEDDEGMRNLYPLAGAAEADADIEAARRSGAQHRDPSGFGWSKAYAIRPPAVDYVAAGLTLAAAADALAPIMPRIRDYRSTATAGFCGDGPDPYGSYDADAWCFGLGSHCFVKLEPDREWVERIWFELESSNPADAALLRAAIESLDRLSPSVIADYWLDASGPVGAPAFLDAYFAALIRPTPD